MASSSPVVIDGLVSAEKVADLLGLETEYPELDYKSTLNLDRKEDLLELAKDVGAMRVRGGYLLLGADGQGQLTGGMDELDLRRFDEARLVPKLLKYIAQPLELYIGVVERDGHKVVVICVPPSPRGCAFFCADGTYLKDDQEEVVFRQGEVFWRDGTRSVRLSQEGLEEVIERRVNERVDELLEEWVKVQREIQRQEQSESPEAPPGGNSTQTPLGLINFDLPSDELNVAVLELVRADDSVAVTHLLNDAVNRARVLIEHEDIEHGLSDLLDKLTCLAAVLLDYDQNDQFERLIATLVQIYGTPTTEDEVRDFAYRTSISPDALAPKIWLAIIERVFAIGGLAVRREKWAAVRELTLQLPEVLRPLDYDRNWLRHALTMASRASHFDREGKQLSLISLARAVAVRLDCLRPDGVDPDDDVLLTSIAEFDFLSNVAAIDAAFGLEPGRVYYTNFARFYQQRVQSIAQRLLNDPAMKSAIFTQDDDALAAALHDIGERARSEGWRYDGFHGWEGTPVGEFIVEHAPGVS